MSRRTPLFWEFLRTTELLNCIYYTFTTSLCSCVLLDAKRSFTACEDAVRDMCRFCVRYPPCARHEGAGCR
jgi:hypothetical protein